MPSACNSGHPGAKGFVGARVQHTAQGLGPLGFVGVLGLSAEVQSLFRIGPALIMEKGLRYLGFSSSFEHHPKPSTLSPQP